MFRTAYIERNIDVLHRSMDTAVLRQNVIANNIANANTPNFKRSTVNFETRLKHALASQQTQPRFHAVRTHTKHFAFHKTLNYKDVRPRRVLDFMTTSKNNGNNVDVEVESMNLLTNQLAYQMMTRSVADMFSRLNIVLG